MSKVINYIYSNHFMGFQRQAEGEYPSLIDSFRHNQTRNGTFAAGRAQQQYVSNFSYLMYEII